MTSAAKRLLASAGLAVALAGCIAGPQPSSAPLAHAEIAQGGRPLDARITTAGVYGYRLQKGPFSLRVPNHASRGDTRDPRHVDIHVCASADPAIFQDITPGRPVAQLRCLNGAAVMPRSSSETAAGVHLMLSRGDGQNLFGAALTIPRPLYDTVNVQDVMDFKVVGKYCMAPNNTRCIDERAMQPFGAGTVYLVVFTDLDGDHTVEAGEYWLLRLDIAG
ncbi:MAG TPA: hypothetical protein VLV87_06135 [Gammaproteobacteria bacterium]|nr:hypothetical protein [Gammaproteobacteria bacterium]